jgi:hypothetical protein
MSTISPSVESFIAEHISSLRQLEILLLLRADSRKRWTAEAMSRELGIEHAWTARTLDDLHVRRLVDATGNTPPSYAYRPATPELDQTIAETARAYDERRVALIELIFSKPSHTIRTFAAAFRFRKGDDDG